MKVEQLNEEQGVNVIVSISMKDNTSPSKNQLLIGKAEKEVDAAAKEVNAERTVSNRDVIRSGKTTINYKVINPADKRNFAYAVKKVNVAGVDISVTFI